MQVVILPGNSTWIQGAISLHLVASLKYQMLAHFFMAHFTGKILQFLFQIQDQNFSAIWFYIYTNYAINCMLMILKTNLVLHFQKNLLKIWCTLNDELFLAYLNNSSLLKGVKLVVLMQFCC